MQPSSTILKALFAEQEHLGWHYHEQSLDRYDDPPHPVPREISPYPLAEMSTRSRPRGGGVLSGGIVGVGAILAACYAAINYKTLGQDDTIVVFLLCLAGIIYTVYTIVRSFSRKPKAPVGRRTIGVCIALCAIPAGASNIQGKLYIPIPPWLRQNLGVYIFVVIVLLLPIVALLRALSQCFLAGREGRRYRAQQRRLGVQAARVYKEEVAAWKRERRHVFEAIARQQKALKCMPLWYPVAPPERTRLLTVTGGSAYGWESFLTTFGASILGAGDKLTRLVAG